MGAKKAQRPKAPAPIPPPVRPEDQNVQDAGNNMIRRLYMRRGRNAQRMNNDLNSTTGGL